MSFLAFEGVVMVLVLVTATVVVTTMQNPPPSLPHANARNELEQRLDDALRALTDIPDKGYPDKMHRIVLDNMGGNATSLLNFFRRALGGDVHLSLTLRTPTQDVLLYTDGSSTRESVSRTLHWIPLNHQLLVVPSMEYVDGSDMALALTMMPLKNGYPVQWDVPIDITAYNETGTTYKATANVVIRDGPTVTMGLVGPGGVVTDYIDNPRRTQFVLRLNNTSGPPLQPGAQLTIHLPATWTDVAQNETSLRWANPVAVLREDGWIIKATLNTTLQRDVVDFNYIATAPQGERARAFHAGYATLDGKSIANLVFRGYGNTTTLASTFTRGVAIALPERLAPGSTSNWSIVFGNPNKDLSVIVGGLCQTNCENVTRITIRQPQHKPIFGSVAGSGWLRLNDSTLEWKGNRSHARDEASEFRFDVTLNNVALGLPQQRSMRVNFSENSHINNATIRVGNAWQVRLPANNTEPGYPRTPPPPGRTTTYTACGMATLHGQSSEACVPYHVSSLSSLQGLTDNFARGLLGSTLTHELSDAFKNTRLSVRADFSPLQDALQGAPGFEGTTTTTLTLYQPWTMKPLWAGTSGLANASFTYDFPANAVHGTYPLVAERAVNLTEGEAIDQIVRLVSSVTLGNRLPDTPILGYEIRLQAWYPDW